MKFNLIISTVIIGFLMQSCEQKKTYIPPKEEEPEQIYIPKKGNQSVRIDISCEACSYTVNVTGSVKGKVKIQPRINLTTGESFAGQFEPYTTFSETYMDIVNGKSSEVYTRFDAEYNRITLNIANRGDGDISYKVTDVVSGKIIYKESNVLFVQNNGI